MSATIHIAGQFRDLVQPCVRCGKLLSDYRRACWPDGQPPPKGWAEGAFVAVDLGWSGIVSDGAEGEHCKGIAC